MNTSVVRLNDLNVRNLTITTVGAYSTALFNTPFGFNYTGYGNITVFNPDGGYGLAQDIVFFSEDCPQPGLIGRGVDCRQCPEGAYCPGGNRIWPLPGWYALFGFLTYSFQ